MSESQTNGAGIAPNCTEAEKDRLLARLADEVDDPALSRIFELASQASPSTEESNR